MDSSNKFAIIIPALNPPLRLVDYVKELRTLLKYPIVLVDDGSRQEEKSIFEDCKKSASDVTILTHDINRGKGRALKTAFSYLLDKYPDIKGCITCDSDGQHRAVDVVKCFAALEQNPEALVLGCRTFNLEHVPWRSRFGNQTMNKLFRIFTKQDFQDTQTGLRAIPTSFMRELIDCPGERFEYETHMLLMIKNRPLVQVPIETIYLDGNSESHFNPVKDSIKISAIIIRYGLAKFFKFVAVSLLSFGVDIAVFSLLYYIVFSGETQGRLLLSVVIARIISLCFNYLCNRNYVFKNKNGGVADISTFLRYLSLAMVIMGASYLLTKGSALLIKNSECAVSFIKIAVDLILFILSYTVQKRLIFIHKD